MKLFFALISLMTCCYGQHYRSHLSNLWYPAKANTLKNNMQNFEKKSEKFQISMPFVQAILVPCGVHDYSGAVASAAYASLKNQNYKRVIVLAPAHHKNFSGVSLPGTEFDSLKSSFGLIGLDQKMLNSLRKNSSLFHSFQKIHDVEHAVEVQVPFIQKYCKDALLVPLFVGSVTVSETLQIAAQLSSWIDHETLLVLSTNLTQFGTYFDCPVDESSGYQSNGLQPSESCCFDLLEKIKKNDVAIIKSLQKKSMQDLIQLFEKSDEIVWGKNAMLLFAALLSQAKFNQMDGVLLDYSLSKQGKNSECGVSYGAMLFGHA